MNMQKNLFKLTLMGVMLLMSNFIFSQVTERERPKEWNQLTEGARFMDRFLPMKGKVLSSDTWGGPAVCARATLIMASKMVSGPIGVETSEKLKTVNITCLYAVGWNVPQKDIWNGPTLMYLMP